MKVHDDAKSHDLADELDAKAFTMGKDVFFGKNEFKPDTKEGKKLIGHELTHVVQQGKTSNQHIQKAEVDESARILELSDSSEDINEIVNYVIDSVGRVSPEPKQFLDNFHEKIVERWLTDGKGHILRSKLELVLHLRLYDYNKEHKDKKIEVLEKKNTKYKGVSFRMWHLDNKHAKLFNPIINVNGIYIGTDKLGHFISEGFKYYKKYEQGMTEKDVRKWGLETEAGRYGLMLVGVRSPADEEANYQGFLFYKELMSKRRMKFDIRKYISNKWNEEVNPPQYSPEVAPVVWANILEGQWDAEIKDTQTNHVNVIKSLKINTNRENSNVAVKIENFIFDEKNFKLKGLVKFNYKQYGSAKRKGAFGITIWLFKDNSKIGFLKSKKEDTLEGSIYANYTKYKISFTKIPIRYLK